MEAEFEAPSLLIGHSLGGAAALNAGHDMPKIKAVATIGAPFDPAHSIVRIAGDISTVDEHGTQVLQIEGRGIPISREFLEVLASCASHCLFCTPRPTRLLVSIAPRRFSRSLAIQNP